MSLDRSGGICRRSLLAGAATLPFVAHDAHASDTHVTVTISNWALQFAAIFVADRLGYFKQESLEVELVAAGGGPKALAALIGGSSQFSASVLGDVLLAYKRGLKNIREFASLSDGYSSLPLLLRKDVASKLGVTNASSFKDKISALKGLRIGITTPGAGSDLLVRYLLVTSHLQPDRDAEIVPVGQPETMRAAMEAARIDACMCAVPLNVLLLKQGTAVPFIDASVDIEALRKVHFVTVHSSKAYNEANPKIALSFARSLVRAARFIATDKMAAKEAVRAVFPKRDETFDDAWEFVYPMLSTDLRFHPEGVQKEIDFQNLMRSPRDRLDVPFAEIVDNSWIEQAEKQ